MSQHREKTSMSFGAMWGWPIVLGVLTAIGLISALFSDGGFGDVLAWITLGIPVLVGGWYGWGPRGPGRARKDASGGQP
ncbi:hypothetical protein QTH91_09905 [Variovorax dokdonensis]|uniref:Uncharacterized protein n=1 Tax=Variovorax dokdonensis TaxID=344883 RepID=A0ABT7NA35_9BURK|nr:hypothetical protein [Variovorax dokdonensis]MDM0044796.1 hypothetical protein [Variovorax dokdonensis]